MFDFADKSPTVRTALQRILECLDGRPTTLKQLQASTGYSDRTLWTHLRTLRERDYVVMVKCGQYVRRMRSYDMMRPRNEKGTPCKVSQFV